MTHVVAIIAARSGSTGLSDKNLREVCGVPLIGHTVFHARQSSLVERVLLSTDSAKYAEVGRYYGAEAPFLRPEELSHDTASAESVLQHALGWLESHEDWRADVVVYLQCTDLFRCPEWIDQCVQRLLDFPELDSAFVGHPTHKHYWKWTDGEWGRVGATDYQPRQKGAEFVREDTGLGCATRASWIRQGRRLGDRVWILPNDDSASGIDVHTREDLAVAEFLMARRVAEGRHRLPPSMNGQGNAASAAHAG